MDGSGSGCLGRGGLARGIHDPILSGTSLIRPTSPQAPLFPVFHQGKSLGEGISRSSPQTSHRTGSSDSRLLQSPIRGPEGLWVLATHQSIVALLPWQCCLSTYQQAYSRHQAIGPALVMTISSLRGCGLCTGALSEALRDLLPGEGTAPATVRS